MFNQNQLQAVEDGAPKDQTQPQTPPAAASFDSFDPPVQAAPPTENADIYYMPDTFRKNNSVAGKQTNIPGVWVLIITVVLLLLLGGGLVVYWLQPSFLSGIFGGETPAPIEIPNDLVETPTQPTPLPTDEKPTQTQGSSKETYLAFQRELAGAATAETYLEIYLKYGTQARYDLLVAEKNRLEDAGLGTQVLDRLRSLGSPVLDGTEDITEVASETEATLSIVKTNNRDTGTVVLVLVDGAWRISEEQWRTNVVEQDTGEIQPGTDSDNDGLTDKEEVVLGTNLNAADSDGDTYADLVEVNNGYNPAGEGKLTDNRNLGTYVNTTFNVSILYPVAWKQTIASTDDSIMLTAPDQQFIQLLVQPNTEREDILSWYKKTFNVETIPTSQLYTNNNWDSVRTPDGLTAYITNKDKSYLFIVTYNLGSPRVLNYKHILDLMLRSLTFRV